MCRSSDERPCIGWPTPDRPGMPSADAMCGRTDRANARVKTNQVRKGPPRSKLAPPNPPNPQPLMSQRDDMCLFGVKNLTRGIQRAFRLYRASLPILHISELPSGRGSLAGTLARVRCNARGARRHLRASCDNWSKGGTMSMMGVAISFSRLRRLIVEGERISDRLRTLSYRLQASNATCIASC